MPLIGDEIKQHKIQLKDLLESKYIDQSLLLGYINVLQSKYQAWIVSDLSGYYNEIESDPSKSDIEFKTIKFFDTIWQDFHYPIIKFFQFNHANLYNQIVSEFEMHQKSNSGNFKVKPVEMRKINDNFVKFIKQVSSFYHTLLKYFSTHYRNQLLPNSFLRNFNYEVSIKSVDTSNANLQANIVFLIHRCLLSLGDLSRHSNIIELSYVRPCISNREFFKFRSFSSKEKSDFMKPHFEKSLRYYKSCILLLPALNEPYNHIGMIYNMVDEKYEACYWFLRSQFTRIPNYTLGLSNFNSVIKKNWFLTNLVDIKLEDSEQHKRLKNIFSAKEKLNYTLVCLVGYFYFPDTYRRGPNIVKNLKYTNIENDFFRELCQCPDLLSENLAGDINFCAKQLVFLFSVLKLLEQKRGPQDVFWKFEKLVFRYIGNLFEIFSSFKGSEVEEQNMLICLRLILNWLKENKSYFKTFNSSEYTIDNFVKLLNSLLDKVKNCEQIKYIDELLESNSRPTRYYYFIEDVYFRDFSLIKFQFKDFKDDHLFRSNNINLLVGDFVDYYQNSELDVDSLSKEEIELKEIASTLNENSEANTRLVLLENIHRLSAVILLGKKCLEGKDLGVTYNSGSSKFERNPKSGLISKNIEKNSSKTEEPSSLNIKPKRADKQDKKKLKIIKKDNSPPELVTQTSRVDKETHLDPEVILDTLEINDEQSQVPDSLEEIESYILHHTTKLQDEMMKNIEKDSPEEEITMPDVVKGNNHVYDKASTVVPQSGQSQLPLGTEKLVSTPMSEKSMTTASKSSLVGAEKSNMMPINSNPQNYLGSYNIWNDQPYQHSQQFPNVLSSPSTQFYQNTGTSAQLQTHPPFPQPATSQYRSVAPSVHHSNGFNAPPLVMPPVSAQVGPYGVPNFQPVSHYPGNSSVVMPQGQPGTFPYPQYTPMQGSLVAMSPAPHMNQYSQNAAFDASTSNPHDKRNHYSS